MKKILRPLAYALLALLVLLAIGIGVLYAMFDGERVKQQLSQVVLEQKQRTLQIEGPLGLSVWPNIAITLGATSLSERNSKQLFVQMDSARVAVAVLPLLQRQVSVSALELAGLKATVVKHKDGRFNLSDLLSGDTDKADKSKDESKNDAKGKPLRIDVSAIKLSNAQLLWVDEKAGTRSTLSNLDVSTGRIDVDTAEQRYVVNKVDIAAKGKTGTDAFEVRLQAPRLAMLADTATGDSVQLTASLTGDKRTVQAELSLNGITGTAQAISAKLMELELDANVNNATVKGKLSSPLAVNVQAQTFALDKLAGNLDVAHPAMPMKKVSLPISGHVRADLAKTAADIGLLTQLDDSKINLSVGVSNFAPLSLGFDLDVNQLNLDKYMPPATPEQAAAAKAKQAAGTAAEPKLDLTALNGLNLSGNLKVGALQVSNIKLAQLQAKIRILDGQLAIAPLSANLYQGTVNGSMTARADGNVITMKQTLTGINIGPLLKDVADKDAFEGRGDVALDISTRGPTVGALKKALAGSASFNLKDGAIKGINLAKSFRELKAKLGGGDATKAANSSDKTDFSELSGTFKIAGGVAHNEDLAMKSPFLRLGGVGDIDIGNSRINYLAKASVVNTDAGQEGQELAQLKGLTIPVRLTGPFDSLSYKIEFENMISDAAKAKVQAQVEEKKQEVKQKVEDALKDKLKGIFGR